jgi:hypothetical protein
MQFYIKIGGALEFLLNFHRFLSCVGIQKHFVGFEIPGFELPNRFSDLTTSHLSRGDSHHNLVFNKLNKLTF